MLHVSGLRRHELTETIEREYTAGDGDKLVIVETTSGFDLIEFETCDTPRGTFTLHHVDRDGVSFWIALADDRQGMLTHVRTTTSEDGVHTLVYRYGDSPPAGRWGYETRDDLRAALGDPTVLAARADEFDERLAAALAVYRNGREHGALTFHRHVYETACTAARVPVVTDEELSAAARQLLNSGDYWLHEYSVDEVLTVQLAVMRLMGIRNKAADLDDTAIRRADKAAGAGPYTREQYEAACKAALLTPLPDAEVMAVTEAALNAPVAQARNIVAYALPGEGAVDITLAMRRAGGIQEEQRDARDNAEQNGQRDGEQAGEGER